MEIKQNISLKQHNTFGLDVYSGLYTEINHYNDINDILFNDVFRNSERLIIGGGSNILFTRNFTGIVVKMNIKGINIIEDNDRYVVIKANAGEEWDKFVEFAVKNNFSGLENLSYIPGNVGSAPIQNIGAFGSEVKDTIHSVEIIDINTGKQSVLSNKECMFGYRDSIFKRELKDKFIITSVYFTLSKIFKPNICYSALKNELAQSEIDNPEINLIRDAVIRVRKSKLPDPNELGNAGSFFKNPMVSREKYEILKKEYPDIKGFDNASSNEVKLAAAWLIETCGWKGYRIGDAGVHKKQSLVLVNYNNARGIDILNLAKEIQNSVYQKFNVEIEMEVNVI
ncbi:MAG: UDP-N-acetylmuramate dehydrogenase [Bacteroidota bacterium]|nr:UDP-N-acetylmuramate dehydrogenase [Bacteroidota bacterium]